MTENRHVPVLLAEVLQAFKPLERQDQATLVDGTLGGGGHTVALLKAYPGLKILGCDADASAIAGVQERAKEFVEQNRLSFFHGNFSRLIAEESLSKFQNEFSPPWSGLLLDLGYSSNQLEDPIYGMSFSKDGPLDMRLMRDSEKLSTGESTAWTILTESSDQELGDILKAYGEIPAAHKLAAQISEAISIGKVKNSTLSLAQFLERARPKRHKHDIHPATLVFQALRIATNDELRVLDHFLEGVILKLKGSAVIAIITFHSLEDRLVKRWGQRHKGVLNALTKKPVVAGAEETAANPRSRSAKLRVYEKR
ncbi:MAG: 16S rRNA (cytosine(1402)-N(4))-methyltransferase RsmH [Bdellovibrionota bacterium]